MTPDTIQPGRMYADADGRRYVVVAITKDAIHYRHEGYTVVSRADAKVFASAMVKEIIKVK